MIERKKLVTRHNPQIHEFDPLSPLTVGNGEFAFTVDATGLQTFPELHNMGMPLCTMSNWGWHSYATPDHLIGRQLKPAMYDTYGRQVGYYSSPEGQEELFDWLRINPHRFHLGQIGLDISLADGNRAQPGDLHSIEQTLDLWNGTIFSRFEVEGAPVRVATACHPRQDMVLVSVISPLVDAGRLQIKVAFPYASHQTGAADWKQPDKHKTLTIHSNGKSIQWVRILDDTVYYCTLQSQHRMLVSKLDQHTYTITAMDPGAPIEFVCLFSPQQPRQFLPEYREGMEAVKTYWNQFWQSGGAVEMAHSRDIRAKELERRVVLSQYLTAIQCSGVLPPQETGLTCNSWYGKAHLEMHWWHAAHFALWSRPEMLANSLWWYEYIMPRARKHAAFQGYPGVRWPKMIGPKGIDTPSKVATLLIWQQPHPIAYAELLYREAHSGGPSAGPSDKTSRQVLERYRDIVMESAEFMAGFAHYDAGSDRYVLGPPVIPAQECHRAVETLNPTYELEYWLFGLKTAQEWRKRLGLEPNPHWEDIIEKLAPLPHKNGVYLAHENCPDTFAKYNYDHPSMLCACGVLPGERADCEFMRNTIKTVFETWNWDRAWGWDFPVVAMSAARVGEPELAVEAFFVDTVKNTWLPNGHNYQRPNLPLYLPGNGGLLLAVAMMAAGWDGCPPVQAPGFPQDGSWEVAVEGIHRYW
jgi:hypothetical protein